MVENIQLGMNGIKKKCVCMDNSNKTRHLGVHHVIRMGEQKEK